MLIIGVVEEEFLPAEDPPVGEDPNFVIPIHHDHLRSAIRIARVVRETDDISHSSRIHHLLVVQTEQVAALDLIVDLPATFALILADHLAAIFGYEFIFLYILLAKTAPSRHLRRGNQQAFLQAPLDANILADGFTASVELVAIARLADVRVTLPAREITLALSSSAVSRRASTAGEPIGALITTWTVFGAQILDSQTSASEFLFAFAFMVTGSVHAVVLHFPLGVGPLDGSECAMRVALLFSVLGR